jgi:hypothetical protein
MSVLAQLMFGRRRPRMTNDRPVVVHCRFSSSRAIIMQRIQQQQHALFLPIIIIVIVIVITVDHCELRLFLTAHRLPFNKDRMMKIANEEEEWVWQYEELACTVTFLGRDGSGSCAHLKVTEIAAPTTT